MKKYHRKTLDIPMNYTAALKKTWDVFVRTFIEFLDQFEITFIEF